MPKEPGQPKGGELHEESIPRAETQIDLNMLEVFLNGVRKINEGESYTMGQLNKIFQGQLKNEQGAEVKNRPLHELLKNCVEFKKTDEAGIIKLSCVALNYHQIQAIHSLAEKERQKKKARASGQKESETEQAKLKNQILNFFRPIENQNIMFTVTEIAKKSVKGAL